MKNNFRNVGRVSNPTIMVIGIIAAFVVVFATQNARSETKVKLTTEYQAVLLSNGQAYFGKLEKAESPYTVLTDVFYVQSSRNPQTNEMTNTLIKRGNEWHAPDRMILNAEHIIFIETVDPDSRVAKLIEELKKK
ncbi:MAG: hypothetical protein SCARUB_04825 [Candidatus Scalindua rubra]|uniref:Uncharacterized protein n=1 Tax=Candidatus Scalindua rubra TaxID=1872076 RepID=A0A1E3X512_9BACT|nr:MAG: hypothetical protein SCARUB_04825 [Candidatus Scalindua rubra]